jgi:hypothetical protein
MKYNSKYYELLDKLQNEKSKEGGDGYINVLGNDGKPNFGWKLDHDENIMLGNVGSSWDRDKILTHYECAERDLFKPSALYAGKNAIKNIAKNIAMSKTVFCEKRGIPDLQIENAPFYITKYKSRDYIVFRYESGAEHFISISDSKYQHWNNKQGGVFELWTYDNPDIKNPDTGTLYIAEGEKDGLALGQFGFSTASVYGALSFKAEHFAFIKEKFPNIQRIRFCFDNDKAGEKGFEKALGAFVNENNIVETLQFPDGTPDKADVTDFVAKHKEKFPHIFLEMGWIKGWKAIAETPLAVDEVENKSVKITSGLFRSKDGYYEIAFDKDGNERINFLSNCVIDIYKTFYTDSGVEYVCRFVKANTESRLTTIKGQDFSDRQSLKKKVSSLGNFFFTAGNEKQLADIACFESEKDSVMAIELLDGYGWFPEHRFFGFPNCIIADDGYYSADDNGIITYNNKHFKIESPYLFLGGVFPDYRLPEKDIDVNELISNSEKIIGDGYYGLLILGWFISTFYSDLFYRNNITSKFSRSFPFLHPIGKKGSGKTETIYRFYGLTGYDQVGDSFEETTQNYFDKAMFANRNIPMWFDEVSSSNRAKIKSGKLKGVYNRSSSGKGTLKGTESLNCNGTLILSGEERLAEIADRSVIIPFPYESERTDRNRDAFHWFTQNRRLLTNISINIMKSRNADNENFFLNSVAFWVDKIKETVNTVTDRIAQNYAVCFTGLELLANANERSDQFVIDHIEQFKNNTGSFKHWLEAEMHKLLDTKKDTDIVYRGLELYLGSRETETVFIDENKQLLFIKSASLTTALTKLNNFNEQQFQEALRTAPYFVSKGNVKRKWDGDELSVRFCITLRADHPSIPKIILSEVTPV